jgi:hypothetical protein
MVTLDTYEGASARLNSRRETSSYDADIRRLQVKLIGLRRGHQTYGRQQLARNVEREIAVLRQFSRI